MNKYLKQFCHRGLIFAGFGPLILSIIYLIISRSVTNFTLDASQVLVSTVSIYVLAFVQAGATVFNQIEGWPLSKSLLCHFSTLYVAYVACYVINSWIPFDIKFILYFTLIFVIIYFVIYLIIYISLKASSRVLNEKIK